MSGVEFLFQVNAKRIYNNKISFVKTELVQKEGEKRLIPIDISGSDFVIDTDYIIMAIGSKLNKLNFDIDLNEKGYINIHENFKTNISNVYACGDCIGQTSTVAWASYSGRETAKEILKGFWNK